MHEPYRGKGDDAGPISEGEQPPQSAISSALGPRKVCKRSTSKVVEEEVESGADVMNYLIDEEEARLP